MSPMCRATLSVCAATADAKKLIDQVRGGLHSAKVLHDKHTFAPTIFLLACNQFGLRPELTVRPQ